jgi:hypothetical protein
MNRHIRNRSGMAAMLVAVLATPVAAQEMERPGGSKPTPPVMEELDRMTGPERGPGAGSGGGEESGRHFEAKKRERLMQALHLDEATRSRLSQRLEQLDQKGEDLRRQRKEAFEALREQASGLRKGEKRGAREGGGRKAEDAPPAAGPAVDSGALKQALERVYAVEDAMSGLRRERVHAVREILTPEQQVKYLFITMKFQKDMRERMQREQGGQEGGPMDMKRRFEGGGDGEKR